MAMSASLRERLKRSGRTYRSPVVARQSYASPGPASPDCTSVRPSTPGVVTPIGPVRSRSMARSSNTPYRVPARVTNVSTPNRLTCQTSGPENSASGQTDTMEVIKHTDKSKLCTEDSSLASAKSSVEKNEQINTSPPSQSVPDERDQLDSDRDCILVLKKEKSTLMQQIAQREEILRKLRLVKMYRSKNDLTELECLISRWQSVSQEALQELHQLASGIPKPSLTDVVNHFQLDHKFIGYNAEEESFS